jgi:hypothetical protein
MSWQAPEQSRMWSPRPAPNRADQAAMDTGFTRSARLLRVHSSAGPALRRVQPDCQRRARNRRGADLGEPTHWRTLGDGQLGPHDPPGGHRLRHPAKPHCPRPHGVIPRHEPVPNQHHHVYPSPPPTYPPIISLGPQSSGTTLNVAVGNLLFITDLVPGMSRPGGDTATSSDPDVVGRLGAATSAEYKAWAAVQATLTIPKQSCQSRAPLAPAPGLSRST